MLVLLAVMAKDTSSELTLLIYDYGSNADRRAAVQAEHLAWSNKHRKLGLLLFGGPFSPPTGAMFVFQVCLFFAVFACVQRGYCVCRVPHVHKSNISLRTTLML